MSKVETYRQTLKHLENWEPFLLKESGLPGPRGNIELAQAVAEEGDEALFEHYLSFSPAKAPTNSPEEFLAFCGVLGQGKLLSVGKMEVLEELRLFAADPRWRTREAVAMALQKFGDMDMDALLDEMEQWSKGSIWLQRAVVAALCEPGLLTRQKHAQRVLEILDRITASLKETKNRDNEGFRVLRQSLGYCWSVAVVALPETGKKTMETWFDSEDKDIKWMMRENLKKNRLTRMDAKWVEHWLNKMLGWSMSVREIGCCGAYCKICRASIIGGGCRGCKLGYETGERDISKSRCKIKICCFRDRHFETCADCQDYSNCKIIHGLYGKSGYKYRKYPQSIEFIINNGYAKFINIADTWKGPYGKLG